jgi:hypothetical protein
MSNKKMLAKIFAFGLGRSTQLYLDSTAFLQKLHLASLLVAPSLQTIQFLFTKERNIFHGTGMDG